MADWKDILHNDERALSDEELLQYINPGTSPNVKHQIEDVAADAFEQDALEGLQQVTNPQETQQKVNALKKQLLIQVKGSKNKRQDKKVIEMKWLTVATVIILLICIFAFLVLQFYY